MSWPGGSLIALAVRGGVAPSASRARTEPGTATAARTKARQRARARPGPVALARRLAGHHADVVVRCAERRRRRAEREGRSRSDAEALERAATRSLPDQVHERNA